MMTECPVSARTAPFGGSVRRLGAAALTAAIVAGQLVAALLADHVGALGFARHPVTPGRLTGAALLALSALLVQRR